MRTIVKSAEPASLAEYRAKPGANYDDYQDKGTLAEPSGERAARALLLLPFRAFALNTARPKSSIGIAGPATTPNSFDYSNLLGACKGNEGALGTDQHCDTL